MFDMNNYIVDGKVKREKIVADIKRGRINRNDILELDKNPMVRNEYFESKKLRKAEKSSWTKKYLDELSLMSVSELFDKEYLLYLNDVAEYIIANEKKKEQTDKMVKGVVIGIVIIVIIVIATIIIASKTKKVTISATTFNIAQNTYLCLMKVLS